MSVLVNLGPLKRGGGQNVALNFLQAILETQSPLVRSFFFVASGSEIETFVSREGLNYVSVPQNPILRIIFELTYGSFYCRKLKIKVIYSYFGSGLFITKAHEIVGAADSNLFYPNVNFWCNHKGVSLLAKKLIDRFRIWRIKSAAGVIFENAALKKAGEELYDLKKTAFIKPSIMIPNNSEEFYLPEGVNKGSGVGLFLCGWQLNKKVMDIPLIAREMRDRGYAFQFILTAPIDNSTVSREFHSLVKLYAVEDLVFVIGPVRKQQLASLYRQVDCVFLLSLLESFSNNIIEAWWFKRPIVISNLEWATEICGEAALYVDRNSVKDISDAIEDILLGEPRIKAVVSKGTENLASYPTHTERARLETAFIDEVMGSV